MPNCPCDPYKGENCVLCRPKPKEGKVIWHIVAEALLREVYSFLKIPVRSESRYNDGRCGPKYINTKHYSEERCLELEEKIGKFLWPGGKDERTITATNPDSV